MRVNPILDAIRFLGDSPLFYIFDLLVIASLVIAAINLSRDRAQRNIRDLSIFALRFVMGCMWWQQSLWKLPPLMEILHSHSGLKPSVSQFPQAR